MKAKELLLVGIILLAYGCGGSGSPENLGDSDDHDDHKETASASHEENKEKIVQHEHEGHGEHEEEAVVKISSEDQKEFGIVVAEVSFGSLDVDIELPGEVRINGDRLAHVTPRVSGSVVNVRRGLGDQVHAGDVMASLESREFAEVRAEYLAFKKRVSLARVNFNREESLWKRKIAPHKDVLEAKQALTEASIEFKAAKQKLSAIGLTHREIQRLSDESDVSAALFHIRAPFPGTVIEKHISLGERLTEDAEAFIVADLSSVWVDLSVYKKDLSKVSEGQKVRIVVAGDASQSAEGTISYVGPLVGEQTRTALARVVLKNRDGKWKPGIFVKGFINTGNSKGESRETNVIIAATAIQVIDDEEKVFVETIEGFEARDVVVGRRTDASLEILKGLRPGEQYVQDGSFVLKAQMQKGAFGDGHNH